MEYAKFENGQSVTNTKKRGVWEDCKRIGQLAEQLLAQHADLASLEIRELTQALCVVGAIAIAGGIILGGAVSTLFVVLGFALQSIWPSLPLWVALGLSSIIGIILCIALFISGSKWWATRLLPFWRTRQAIREGMGCL